MTEITGGCACGEVRFKITQPSRSGVGVCHCLDCQKASGGGPNLCGAGPQAGVRGHEGRGQGLYLQGRQRRRCRARLLSPTAARRCGRSPGGQAPFFPVKLGAFDDSSGFAPDAASLHRRPRQPWHLMDEGLPALPEDAAHRAACRLTGGSDERPKTSSTTPTARAWSATWRSMTPSPESGRACWWPRKAAAWST